MSFTLSLIPVIRGVEKGIWSKLIPAKGSQSRE